jgi:hypothetical protein
MGQLFRTIVITGASRGLGEALALLFATHGRTLGLLEDLCVRLEAVAGRCRTPTGQRGVGTDVTDGTAIAQWSALRRGAPNRPADRQRGHLQRPQGLPRASTKCEILRTNLEAPCSPSPLRCRVRARRSAAHRIVGRSRPHPLAMRRPTAPARRSDATAGAREWLAPDNVAVSLVIRGTSGRHRSLILSGRCPPHVGRAGGPHHQRGLDRDASCRFPRRLLWLIRRPLCPGACARCWVRGPFHVSSPAVYKQAADSSDARPDDRRVKSR